ncbi:hypothetical protein JW964_12340 [candidate division KSB1 bacterium]|nr:hypothetical protein [candidate division KSB1 bacterium]
MKLSLILTCFILMTTFIAPTIPQNKKQNLIKASTANKLTGLLLNYDCTDFFFNNPPDQINGQVLDEQIALFARAGVSVLLCNTNAQRTNYASEAFESFWQGYDPDGPDDQPFLADMLPERRANYRRMIASMRALHLQNIDYPARVIQRCREHQISPWISLRMNDIHDNDRINHPIHSTFWREHPQYWRVADRKIDYYDRALDYAHPEVRARYQALIEETLMRYDIDGLELDFMREPYLFKPGHELAGGKILTEWLQMVHQLVKKAEKKWQHPIKIGVRVPANPITAQNLGLNVTEWAQLGLVDLVVVTPRWATMDTNLPMQIWKQLLSPHAVTLAGGLEIREQSFPDGPARLTTPDVAFGAATATLYNGADVIYLFNYFPSMTKNGWTLDQFIHTLQTMKSPDRLVTQSRRHLLTFRDVFAPGEATDYPLPASGKRLLFRLPTGPKPVGRWVIAKIGINKGDEMRERPIELLVNSTQCEFIERQGAIYHYKIPENVLQEGVQLLEVFSLVEESVTVERVEIEVGGK